jgi:threonine/homoserine/homoserine lactone efflux protein
MPEWTTFGLFLTATLVLAFTLGPGIFYVLTRSIKGGRREGSASALGTAVGGMAHVVAAGVGLSAILMTSAVAFTIVKYAGAAYLIYLGIRILLERETLTEMVEAGVVVQNQRTAFYQGIVTELLNPKTALFFLSFLPQFINPQGAVLFQFMLLGSITIFCNTAVDFIVVTLAEPIRNLWQKSERGRRGQRVASGVAMITLGAYVATSGNSSE